MSDRKEWPTVALGDLIPWPGLNPRQHFDQEELDELRASIAADGLLQPLGVKANEQPPHWIFAGERRWQASQGVLDEVPVFWREIDEAAAHRLALTENIQRANLTALEEANGIQRYIDASEKSQSDVADELGKTQGWVSNRLRLLKLHPLIQDLMEQGHMSATQARDLVLPFAGIEPDKWAELNRGVSSKLRKVVAKLDRPLVDEEIRLAVSDVAMAMSNWLTRDSYHYDADGKKDWSSALEIPEAKWKGAPAGSIVKYAYGRYAGDRKTARAFSDTWWEERMAEADVAYQKDVAARAGMNDGPGEEKDLGWAPENGPIPADVEIPWSQLHTVYGLVVGGHYTPRTLHRSELPWYINADPRLIPADQLVLWEGDGSRPAQVLCTNQETFTAAKVALHDTFQELVTQKRAEDLAKDLERSRGINMAEATPALVAGAYDYDASHLDDAAAALGLEFPEEYYEGMAAEVKEIPWPHRIISWLVDLGPEKRDELFRLTVVKVLGSDGREAPEKRAAETLTRMLFAELEEKVGGRFVIPGNVPEGEPDGFKPLELVAVDESGEEERAFMTGHEEEGEPDDDSSILPIRYQEHLEANEYEEHEANEAEEADQLDESEAPRDLDIF